MQAENEAKRGYIKHLLQEGPNRFNREIGRLAKCDKKTVQRVKDKLAAGKSLRDAPRPGQQPALKGESLQAALDLVETEQPSSSKVFASLLDSKNIASLKPRTIRKYMQKKRNAVWDC